jgi:hypothetical protein
MTEHFPIIYPGQPFIEDGLVAALQAFSSKFCNDRFTPYENVCASRSVVATMIGVESIKKHALHNHNKLEGKTPRETLHIILHDKYSLCEGFTLWDELRIVRNGLVHSSLFFDSTTNSEVSEETKSRLVKEISKGKVDEDRKTMKWKLEVNPLRVTRYEALVALTFFYWLGKSTSVWKNGTPFDVAFADARLNYVFESGYITKEKYNLLLTRSGEMEHFLGYSAHHLTEMKKKHYFKMTSPLFNVDLEVFGNAALGISS